MIRNLEKYTQKYMNTEHYDFEKYQVEYRRKNIIEQLDNYTHKNILEVGCGIDPLFQYVDNFDSYTVVEPSTVFSNKANKLSRNKNITIINDFIENIRINKKYDFIVVSSLLHEIEEPTILLNSVKKLLSQTGILYINVPNAKSFHRLLAYKSLLIDNIYVKSENQKKFQQAHTFDMESLTECIIQNGYTKINGASYFIKPFTHYQMKQLLDHNIITKEILDGLNQMIEYCPDIGSEIFITCQIKKEEHYE